MTVRAALVHAVAIFGQTGPTKSLTHGGSKQVLALTYGFGAVACLIMVLYRYAFLHESKVRARVLPAGEAQHRRARPPAREARWRRAGRQAGRRSAGGWGLHARPGRWLLLAEGLPVPEWA